jgi:hypothetical protein
MNGNALSMLNDGMAGRVLIVSALACFRPAQK